MDLFREWGKIYYSLIDFENLPKFKDSIRNVAIAILPTLCIGWVNGEGSWLNTEESSLHQNPVVDGSSDFKN